MLNYLNNENGAWILRENEQNVNTPGRCESLFHLANGYMGIRSASEEETISRKPGMFISGTFNRFEESEVTELPNVPDMSLISLCVNGEHLHAQNNCIQELNLQNGLYIRKYSFITKDGINISIAAQRIVSMAQKHCLAQTLEIVSDKPISVTVKSGINGRITNSGVQHFGAREKRIYDNHILQAIFQTMQSCIKFILCTSHNFYVDNKKQVFEQSLEMDNRTIYLNYTLNIDAGKTYKIEKISTVHTTRDKHTENLDFENLKQLAVKAHKLCDKDGFDSLLSKSSQEWKRLWDLHDVDIQTNNIFDKVAIRYSIFQLIMMTPTHDNRMNIGAKGLSGEAYKGHTFWDTEIFMLPFWIATNPCAARSLLEYRYLSLDGARQKALDNGYVGAMYPWESAWITDGEATPKLGAADVVTGQQLPIICGDIEQHITADIAYAVWYYYEATNDDDFMNKFGYEIIFETAQFWQSRFEWNEKKQHYEITNVIGPDEYSEHVSNNAYTNQMAWHNVNLAIKYYDLLKVKNKKLFNYLNLKLSLSKNYETWKLKSEKLYLQKPNKDGLIPQDDTYLDLKEIDISKYKVSEKRAEIIKDYNMHQISQLQISKQADILVLLHLFEEIANSEITSKNFKYYEAHCLHDSSLSLAIHCIMACKIKNIQLAQSFFEKACKVDLNQTDNASDGIHAASMGGLWQCVIHGFAGIKIKNNILHLTPSLPSHWESIRFKINLNTAVLDIKIKNDEVQISSSQSNVQKFIVYKGKQYLLEKELFLS